MICINDRDHSITRYGLTALQHDAKSIMPMAAATHTFSSTRIVLRYLSELHNRCVRI